MKIDDVRKTVSNPKPLYFAAGLGDAAVEVLKDAPTHLNTLSSKAGVVATDVAGKVAGTAESLQSRIALSQLDPKALRGQLDPKALRAKISELSEPDLRAAREKAQTLLLQQVGWALEVAGKAVETYDEYAERGKVAVERVRGGRGTGAETVADGSHTERVVVERVTVVDAEEAPAKAETPKADAAQDEAPKSEAPKDDAPKAEAKAQDKPAAEDAKPGAKKQPTPPRRQVPRNGK